MTRINTRKALTAAAVAAAIGFGTVGITAAQPFGYGPGYGMMGGYAGMEPGMMYGYGGGYGMGPGMMYGYESRGPGMMYGYAPESGWNCYGAYGLDLSKDQESKLAAIQNDFARTQVDRWATIREEQLKLRQLYADPKRDDTAIASSRARLSKLQREMFQAGIEAHNKMDAILTPDQREQLGGPPVGATR
jgi:Spy/CpxP family protein refolding chaperone